ncbi:unnamed protein product [Schistosoma mattheei]|uniref:Uncharacterized protein n=1 Tax=Schistosoma mattheei TaxID=31246 RepID=A0A183PFB0_9TREM|nr:unnamed protein product [Schistosoma mattheei]
MNSHLNLNTVVTDGVNSSLDEDNEDEEAEEEVNKYHFRKLNTDNINNDYVYNMNCEPSVSHHTRQRHHQMLTKRPRLSTITSEHESFHNQINTTNNNHTNQHHMNCSQLHQRDLIITSTSMPVGYTTNAVITNSNENNNGDNPYTTFRSMLLQSDYNTNDNSSPEKENRTSILTLKSRLNHYVSDDDDDVDDDVPDNEHVENMSTSESNLILHEAHNIDRFPSLLKHNSHVDYHQVLNDESVSNRNDELHEYKG